ncbi:MAG: hypothetical protein ACR2PG_09850 [Hyphomicrobiaceae bacterium]
MLRFMAGVVGYIAAIAVGFAFYIHIADRQKNSSRIAQFSSAELWESRSLASGDKLTAPSATITGSIHPPSRRLAATSTAEPAVGTASISDQPVGRRWTIKVVRSHDEEDDQHVSRKPSSVRSKAQLTRAIQREIKRVGCGRVYATGYWDRRTKAAIANFVANRNSALPTDQPTDFLLSLLKTYPGDDCGRSRDKSPNGQPRLVKSTPIPANTAISGASSDAGGPPASAAARVLSGRSGVPVNEKPRYRDIRRDKQRGDRMALGAEVTKPVSQGVVPSVAAGGPTYSGPSDLESSNAAKRRAKKRRLQRARKTRKAQRRAKSRAKSRAKRRNRSTIRRATVNRAAQVARDRRERWVTRMLSRDLD